MRLISSFNLFSSPLLKKKEGKKDRQIDRQTEGGGEGGGREGGKEGKIIGNVKGNFLAFLHISNYHPIRRLNRTISNPERAKFELADAGSPPRRSIHPPARTALLTALQPPQKTKQKTTASFTL